MKQMTPYQPMGPRTVPAGDEQVAGMFRKLASRAGVNVSVCPETQSPQAKSILEWRDPVWTSQHGSNGAGYRETVCGRFTISKDGHELGFSYTAWRREAEFPPTLLGVKATAKEAMNLCEDAQ